MTETPDVSVVMSVYNGADSLQNTIESILFQNDVSLEFIIVNDGSVDQTGAILVEYQALDPRIRIIDQSNQGLTKGLIVGCALARGRYIARQDAGDTSMPGRLARQFHQLEKFPNAVLSSSGTQFVTSGGEPVYAVSQTDEVLQHGLNQLSVDTVRGPSHHASTMFRRDAYERVGGYRVVFSVAQDLDLWMRLSEVGICLALPDLLYQAKLSGCSISVQRRDEQIRTAKTILQCAAARRTSGSESPVLSEWSRRKPDTPKSSSKTSSLFGNAKLHYFVARAIHKRNRYLAGGYYLKAFSYSICGALMKLSDWAHFIKK